MDAIRLYLQDQPLLPTRTARFAADEFLFHAGEPADEFFLLKDGLVALEMNRVTIATIGDDELLGVSWLLTPRAWTWDARALQPVNALAIDVEQLIALCEQDHSVGYHFMKQVGSVLEWRFLSTALQAANLYADWS
ncbi:MAG TPA: cyclic nucleotide-binding domain-containing protein [Acetobacteraceae bacterium]|nr:cyclic nucleotide-binding domain-containing protein [Acetobacteraceae bacterium]